MRAGALILPVLLSLAPLGAAAQEPPPAAAQVQSLILTIEVERLLAETRLGQRIRAQLRERTEALAAENEQLRLELTEEEQSLTERRPTMEVEAFRAAADAFDERVQRIRAEQDAKERALEAAVERGRQEFLNAATSVLGRLMIDSGAAVILERREVFLSASLIDITDEAIAAIDAQLGDGSAPPPADPPPPAETGEPAPGAGPTASEPDPAPPEPAGDPAAGAGPASEAPPVGD